MAIFYNYSTEDFEQNWANKPYLFKAGEVYQGVIIAKDGTAPLELNDVLARFFSKHLADKVMNTPALNQNFVTNSEGIRVATNGYPDKYNLTNMEMLIERGMAGPDETKPMPSFSDELPIKQAEVPKVEVPVPAPLEPEAPKKKAGRPPKKVDVLSPSPGAQFNM